MWQRRQRVFRNSQSYQTGIRSESSSLRRLSRQKLYAFVHFA